MPQRVVDHETLLAKAHVCECMGKVYGNFPNIAFNLNFKLAEPELYGVVSNDLRNTNVANMFGHHQCRIQVVDETLDDCMRVTIAGLLRV